MANSLPLVLEIIAKWSKKSFSILFILLFTSSALLGQKEKPTHSDLSGKKLAAYNELFFAAEKDFNLGDYKEAFKKYTNLYKISPDNATICFRLAEMYSAEGNREEAVFYAEKAASLDSENKWFKRALVSIYQQFSFIEKEILILDQLVTKFPKNPDYRFELATAYRKNEELKKALKELNKLEEQIGVNEVITDEKKSIYLQSGDVDAAANELEKLIEAFPKELDYYGILGHLYEANLMDKKALTIYSRMLEISPKDPRPHLDLANFYQKDGNREKSLFHLKIAIASPELDIDRKIPALLSLFNASEQDSTLRRQAFDMLENVVKVDAADPKAYAIYGDFLSRDGFNDKALDAYKTAVTLEGGNKFQIWEQILLIEIQTNNFDSLQIDGPKAIDLFPNQPLPYLFTGIAFIQGNVADEGVLYLEEGLNFVFGNPRLKEQFYTQLADGYHRLEKHERSDGYFDKALTLNSKNPTLLNNYAYYLSERETKLDKALEMTERSNILSPANPVFLDTWAWVLYKKGDYPAALEKIEQVIQLSPIANGEILEHYGDILFKNNQKDKALKQYKQAQQIGGASENIEDKIKSLSSQ